MSQYGIIGTESALSVLRDIAAAQQLGIMTIHHRQFLLFGLIFGMIVLPEAGPDIRTKPETELPVSEGRIQRQVRALLPLLLQLLDEILECITVVKSEGCYSQTPGR